MSISLTPQQHDAIYLPPEVIVSAAAGSGKTEVLVRRVLHAAIEQAVPLDRMLIVTFTRAAAAELRERIRNGLQRLVGEADAETIRAQLAALDRAQISTIHSFCLEVVQRYGYLHGLSAERILPDDEARMLRHELAGELLRTRLDHADPDLRNAALAWGGVDGVGADDLSNARGASGLRDILLRLHDFRRSLPDPARWYREHVALAPLDPERADCENPLVQAALEPLRRWCRELGIESRRIANELHALGDGTDAASLLLARCRALETIENCADWGQLAAALSGLDECLDLPYKPKGLLAGYARDVRDEQLKAQISDLAKSARAELDLLRIFYEQPWREVAQRENETRRRLLALWQLAEEFDGVYAARKREAGAVDYADLEAGALALLAQEGAGGEHLADSGGTLLPAPLASEVCAQFDIVFIDEYQDTSPIQDAIVELVTPESVGAKSRFIVGDLKQSIYAFRLAEPALFAERQRALADNGAGRALKLTGSFRSRPRLITAINQVFTGLMDAELGGEEYTGNQLTPQVDYTELCGAQFTPDPPARLHLVEIDPGLAAQSENEEAAEEVVDSPAACNPQYARVASILGEIHSSRQLVYDKALGEVRPVQWRDMAVLLRTSRGRVENLRRELERAGIPSYAPGRSGFYERPEVSDALSLLAVVDNPRQDIALAAVLTGPAVGLTPADLARIVVGSSATLTDVIAPGFGNDDFFSKVERYAQHGSDPALKSVLLDFLQRLSTWRNAARHEPLDRLLSMLYRESGLLGAAAALQNGRQRLANLEALAERARQFAALHSGVFGFLEDIQASRRAAGDSGEAPLLSEQQDVVRVLTVHQAKGLEFPIVVVPDLQRRFHFPELHDDVQWHYRAGIGGRHIDLAEFRRYDTLGRRAVREARKLAAVSEELRILYVALTRARERLELVGTVERGISLTRLTRRRGADASCWLQWIGSQLGDAVANAQEGSAATCGEGDCWEVAVHGESTLARMTSEPQSQLTASELGLVTARIQAEYPDAGSSQLPAKVAVTQLSETTIELDGERAVPLGGSVTELTDVHPIFMRSFPPSASDVGTAVHKLLAAMHPQDFARYADGREALRLRYDLVRRGLLSRVHADCISLEQVSRCAADLAQALPDLVRDPCQSFAELPVSLLVPARELTQFAQVDPATVGNELVHVQGAIDLLFDNGRTALILDYKTGYTADGAELARIHEQQLLWYCRAVSMLLPGRQVRWALYGLGGAGLVGPFDYAGAGNYNRG